MAYIIGMVDEEELAALNAAGWEDEDPPAELLRGVESDDDNRLRMFWVDSDVYSIMSGPGWEPVSHTTDCALEYTVILLRPDYIADEFGKDVYHTFVMADGPEAAVTVAQRAAAMADNAGVADGFEDYHPLFVCRGRVASLANY